MKESEDARAWLEKLEGLLGPSPATPEGERFVERDTRLKRWLSSGSVRKEGEERAGRSGSSGRDEDVDGEVEAEVDDTPSTRRRRVVPRPVSSQEGVAGPSRTQARAGEASSTQSRKRHGFLSDLFGEDVAVGPSNSQNQNEEQERVDGSPSRKRKPTPKAASRDKEVVIISPSNSQTAQATSSGTGPSHKRVKSRPFNHEPSSSLPTPKTNSKAAVSSLLPSNNTADGDVEDLERSPLATAAIQLLNSEGVVLRSHVALLLADLLDVEAAKSRAQERTVRKMAWRIEELEAVVEGLKGERKREVIELDDSD